MMWLVLGLIFGALIAFLALQQKDKKVDIKWYQWLLGIITLSMFLLLVQNYIGLRAELEFYAANFFLWAMGIPTVIFALFTYFSKELFSRLGNKKSASADAQ